MAMFEQAIDHTVLEETGGDPNGGLVTDQGGLTKWGISEKANPGVDIANLTRDGAVAIYRSKYWLFGGVTDQRLAGKIFDAYVNMESGAVKCLQLALSYLQAGPIVADGVWGPKTESAVNAADPQQLLDEFKMRLVKYRHDRVAEHPEDAKDLIGWWRRDVKG